MRFYDPFLKDASFIFQYSILAYSNFAVQKSFIFNLKLVVAAIMSTYADTKLTESQ